MSKKQKRVFGSALLAVLISVLALVFVAARPKTGVATRPQVLGTQPDASSGMAFPNFGSVMQGNAKPPLEAELVVIRPGGFEPATITRPVGRFVLVVHNRSGSREIAVRLDRERGDRLREIRFPSKKLKWSDELNLPPGRYVLTGPNNPGWSCVITITPK